MSERGYWFDVTPLLVEHEPPARPAVAELRDSWSRDRSVKGRLSSLRHANAKDLLKDALIPDRRNRIEEFAHANALGYVRWQQRPQTDLPTNKPRGSHRPGLLFGSDANDLVSWPGWPFVEFGNLRPYGGLKWGYVALRHDLHLPHVVLDSRANDAAPTEGGPIVTSLTRRDGPRPAGRSLLEQLKGRVARLEVDRDTARELTVWAEIGREQDALDLLSRQEVRTAYQASLAFDIEITDSWVFLYGYEFDVSTTEAERWAWIFAVTSRWIDALHACADGSGAVDRPPFHTAEVVARPSSLTELPRSTGHLGGDGFWAEPTW